MPYKKNNGSMTYEQAKEKALRLLEFRSHSERELKDKLRRAEAKDEDIEKIIEFCKEYKFVNDEDFARRKAADLKNIKRYGKNRIKSELYSVGISSDIINTVLCEMDFDDEEDILKPLVEKKLKGNFERKNIDKCIRYFIYRGYELSDIRRCVDALRNEYDEYDNYDD